MKNFVVIDASPLIGLAIVDGLSWLPKIFDIIYVSKIVKNEVLPGTEAQGEDAIVHAFESGWLKVWSKSISPLSLNNQLTARVSYKILNYMLNKLCHESPNW